MAFRKQWGGAECTDCCEVDLTCDCDIISCVMDFVRYALNKNAYEYTGHLVHEVFEAGNCLVGFAALGTYETHYEGSELQQSFGRVMVKSMIDTWGVSGTEMQTYLQEIDRIFYPYWQDYKYLCGCDEENEFRVDCLALDRIMMTIHTYGQIGLTGNPPYTLEEWAYGGICGVCYKDCNGDDWVQMKDGGGVEPAPAPPPVEPEV